jgi:hypothetical protein
MKTKFYIFLVLLLAVGFILPVKPVSARTTRIEFKGSEWCDPSTMSAIKAWLAGPNLQVRGFSQVCSDTADIPQMTGTTYLYDGKVSFVGEVENFVINGKLRTETDEGGVWVASWQLGANSNIVQIIGHGEGIYEGLQLHWFVVESDEDSSPFEGYILDPGK